MQKKETNEINEEILKKKRKFDDGFIGNTIKFDYKKWNKEIDVYELLLSLSFKAPFILNIVLALLQIGLT